MSAIAFAGVIALMAGVAVLILDISTRKTLGFSILGTIDLTQLAQVWCVFLALPLVFLRESHIAVDFLTARFPRRLQAVVHFVAALLGVALLAAILGYSWQQAAIQVRQGDRSVTLGIPMAFYWAPLLAGTALSILASALVLFKEARKLADG